MNEYIRPLGHKQLMISRKKILLDDHWRQVIEGLENWVWRMGGTQGNSRGQISRDKEILIIIHIFASLPWDSQDGRMSHWPSLCLMHTFTPSVCSLHGQAGMRYTQPCQLVSLGAGSWGQVLLLTKITYIREKQFPERKPTCNMKGNQMCPTIKKVTNVYYEWNFAEKETMWF